ncbi:MAG: PDZ domain-containing protein [Gemmatimonadaceae bacterium]
MLTSRRAIKTLSILVVVPAALHGQQRSADYEISFPNAAQHEAKVVVTYRGVAPGSTLNAVVSKSSPGRYALATFAKNVYDVVAVDGRGRRLATARPNAHQWAIKGHDGTVRISYTVWGDRIDGTYLSIDHAHAHLNMPATFMFAHGMEAVPIRLKINRPAGWSIATQLIPTADSAVFTAPNLQWFMDSPTEVGPVIVRSWTRTFAGKPSTWRVAVHHLGTATQVDSFAVMTRAIVDESIAIWGEPAGYDQGTYTFLNDYLPWASGDGMEHRNSTIITSSGNLADRAARINRLGTVSHEFFHSWNMERLRSKAIEPFAFDGENMSSELWFGEGFTSYYGPLIIRRAGFYTDEEYAQTLSGAVVGTLNSAARLHGSAADMSRLAPFFDGATYLDPVNRQNTFLSYYTWGSVIALGLDLTLRERYGKTLDGYMRLLWKNYGRLQTPALAPLRPYTMADLRLTLGTFTADTAFANDFFRRYVEGREVQDFAPLLAPAGFLLATDSTVSPWLGASLDNDSGKVFVNWSGEGSSAYEAGISSGDIIYSVDGVPAVSIDTLSAIIARHRVGDVVKLDVEQRKVRRVVRMTLKGRREMRIVTNEAASRPITESIRQFRKAWLGSRQ